MEETTQITQEAPAPEKKKKDKGKIILIILLLLLLLAMGIGGFLLYRYFTTPKDVMEPNAVIGMMPGKTDQEILDELNRQVDEKSIAFSINSKPTFADGKSKGNWMFENPQSNNKYTRMEVFRDDTGELIYETGRMAPGTYVPDAKLKVPLPKGEYVCTVYIHGYRMKDNAYIGKVAAGITVVVEN